MTDTTVDLAKLRTPFDGGQVGKLPRITCPDCSDKRKQCSDHERVWCDVCKSKISTKHIHIDYVGHGDVTIRLLDVDPEWNWEPKAEDEHGLPVFDLDDKGGPVGLWIRLTVGGVTRLGYGSVPSGQPDAVKVLIGDALRNAAMRFGVALDLWAKGERADPTAENATASAGQAARRGRGQSAADAFKNATPAPPRQNGSSENGQGQWLAAALKQAPKHATIGACTAVWNKSAEMVKAGELPKADAAKLQDLLRKRVEELKAAPPVAADLDPDDPWTDKVADITTDSEGEAVVAEAGELLGKGEIDGARYERIGNAVEAALARISRKAAA